MFPGGLGARTLQALQLAKSAKVSVCGVRHCKGWAPQGHLATEHCKNIVGLGTAGMHCHGNCRNTAGSGTEGYSAVGRCKNTLRLLLVTAGMRCGWALQAYSEVGHCRDILRLDTAGLCGWALQGYFAVGRCKGTQPLGTAGIPCGWSGIARILGG